MRLPAERGTQNQSRCVYILYTPRRESFNVLVPFELKELQKKAEAKGKIISAYFPIYEIDLLDKAVAKGCTAEQIIAYVHKVPFRSFVRVWIAGNGSSRFARKVIEEAFEYSIRVEDHTPAGSPLGKYLRWFREYKARTNNIRGAQQQVLLGKS